MSKTWKPANIVVLILIGLMQVFPFISNHQNCQEACCVTEQICCEIGAADGCQMSMTSCSVVLFLPLVSAPLIKVETNVPVLEFPLMTQVEPVLESQVQSVFPDLGQVLEAPPPGYFPLLI